jgi:hypothetical protein
MNHTGTFWTESSSSNYRGSPVPDAVTGQEGGVTVIVITGADRPAIFVPVAGRARSAATRRGDLWLAPGEAQSFARAGQTVQVVSGGAWVTFGGQDTIVLPGQQVVLEPGPDAAVVSALGTEPLVYRLIDRPEESE